MSLSGPLNIWGQSAGVSGPPLPLTACPGPRHRAPYLDLLDFVLDSLDGVPVYVIPRIHLLRRHGLCSDHCNRGRRAQQGWRGPEELPCPCPCQGPCGAPGAAAPCGTDPLLPRPTGAPRTHPTARGAAVTHGTQRDGAGTRSTTMGSAAAAPSAGGTQKGLGAGLRELPDPPAPNNGGAGSIPAQGQAAPHCTVQPGHHVPGQPRGCPVTAGRCSAASSLPDAGCWPRSLHVMQAQKPHPPRAASCPRCLQQEPGRLHGDAEGRGSAKMQPGTGGGEVLPGQPGQRPRTSALSCAPACCP